MRTLAVVALALAVSGCTSANTGVVATVDKSGDCRDQCVGEQCERVDAAVITGPGEMVALRAGTGDVVRHRFAGADVKREVMVSLSCMGSPTLERRSDGVFASCAVPPADVRVPVRLTTPSMTRVTYPDFLRVGGASAVEGPTTATMHIVLGPLSAVVQPQPCFTPKRDGLVTCEPAGHCFVYSTGQLTVVTLK